MDIPSLLRRSTDTDLMKMVLSLAETVRRLEEKVDILLIGGQVSESPVIGHTGGILH
jgi:hypothetical protein